MTGESAFLLGTAGVVAAYVAVGLLLLGMNLWVRLRWWIKAGTILVTGGFFFVAFYGTIGVLGWPTEQEFPEQFELVSAMIMEPDPSSGFPGAIYVWLTPLPGELVDSDTGSVIFNPAAVAGGARIPTIPRAYRIPYSASAERQVMEAQIKQVEGVREIGTANRRPMKPGEHAPQVEFHFHERPDPELPSKSGGGISGR